MEWAKFFGSSGLALNFELGVMIQINTTINFLPTGLFSRKLGLILLRLTFYLLKKVLGRYLDMGFDPFHH
jgi:hypothetical protein